MKKNWHWPKKQNNNYVAWYTILRRLPGLPIIYVGKILVWMGVSLSYGIKYAINFWKYTK